MEKKESKIIKKALQYAQKAFRADEVPVAAVIYNTKTGQILTATRNQTEAKQDVLAHAEMLAIRQASKKLQRKFLDGYSMFVTLEPCTMCAAAIAWARMDAVYYGATDPKTGGVRQGSKVFTRSQTHHKIKNQLKSVHECGQIMHEFFQKKRNLQKLKKQK